MQRQASGSSRLVPELPFWGSGRQSGQRSTLFGDHWLLQTPSLPGVTALELPHSLQGQVQPPGMGGICPLPQEELAGLAAVPWRALLPVRSTY